MPMTSIFCLLLLNSDKFICLVKYKYVEIESLIFVPVQMQPPRFSMQPSSSNSIVREGTTKILQCSAIGNYIFLT